MYPVLLSLGGYPVATFGIFLVLAVLFGLFIIWRLTLVYDLDRERVLDLSLISIIFGFIFARLFFVLLNIGSFTSISKIVFVNLYPGLFLWGGIFGALVGIYLLSPRFKLSFWQLCDFAVVALILSLSIGGVGCLLGSCHYGPISNLPFAVFQSGVVGKRLPLQIVESLLFLAAFTTLWKGVLRFHFNGQIASKGLIFLGLIKLILGFFQADQTYLASFPLERMLSILMIFLGTVIYYNLGKRSFKADLQHFFSVIFNKNKRSLAISKFNKSCYNLKVDAKVALQRGRKRVLKLLNVKPNPSKF